MRNKLHTKLCGGTGFTAHHDQNRMQEAREEIKVRNRDERKRAQTFRRMKMARENYGIFS